jgi:hypothetical protein
MVGKIMKFGCGSISFKTICTTTKSKLTIVFQSQCLVNFNNKRYMIMRKGVEQNLQALKNRKYDQQ